jgi:magnesium chelatase subunit D
LPVGASTDRLAGTLDIEKALSEGRKAFEPGLLAAAHRGILYVDEVNLLSDHLVDLLLDVAAMGVNHVEREGVGVRHPSRFVLVGTMNPEEGELRPQLLDRFGVTVEVAGSPDPAERVEVVRRRLHHEADPGTSPRSGPAPTRSLPPPWRRRGEGCRACGWGTRRCWRSPPSAPSWGWTACGGT